MGAIHPSDLHRRYGKLLNAADEVSSAAYLTTCKVDDEDLSLIHDPAKLQRLFRLGEDPAERRISQKGADLVLDGRDRLGLQARRIVVVLRDPKLTHLFVSDSRHNSRAVRFVVEDPEDIGERRVPAARGASAM